MTWANHRPCRHSKRHIYDTLIDTQKRTNDNSLMERRVVTDVEYTDTVASTVSWIRVAFCLRICLRNVLLSGTFCDWLPVPLLHVDLWKKLQTHLASRRSGSSLHGCLCNHHHQDNCRLRIGRNLTDYSTDEAVSTHFPPSGSFTYNIDSRCTSHHCGQHGKQVFEVHDEYKFYYEIRLCNRTSWDCRSGWYLCSTKQKDRRQRVTKVHFMFYRHKAGEVTYACK